MDIWIHKHKDSRPNGNATTAKIWMIFLEKCKIKLSGWKRNSLSLGGRLTLISTVLDSLPTYAMSLFPLSNSRSHRMDRLQRDFFWQGTREHKTYNMVNWEKVTTDRNVGGL